MVEKVINGVNKIDASGHCVPSETTNLESKDIELNFVRNKLETFQTNILKDVEKRMTGMIDEVLQEIRQHNLQKTEFKNFANARHKHSSQNTWDNRVAKDDEKSSKTCVAETDITDSESVNALNSSSSIDKRKPFRGKQRHALPDKVFVTRESYLTALLEVDHMKTIYHIFFIILMVLFMNSICYDYFVEGRINFGLGTFKSGLNKIHYVFGIWSLEHLVVLTLYYAFKGWAHVRSKLLNQKHLMKFWTHSCLITYISSQILFGFVASVLCLKLDLPFISASVLLLESTRLLMKMHAFVRFNAGRVLAGKTKIDVADHVPALLPPFSSYLYFLFAPTLIYRNLYPRTSQIRWRFAAACFIEVVAIAFLYSYIHERHIKVHFQDFGREALTASTLIVKLFGMMMPSIIIFLCGFYLILHSWLNFTAELLRFGDRMFYKDWWTASTYDAYFRNWNVVVHDWLYEYIYKDFYTHIFKGSKLGASLMVFFMSALVHEYLLSYALQIFFPVIFFFFGILGVAFVFITRKLTKNIGNIFLWFGLIVGNGMIFSLYSMEYYARLNCPKVYSNLSDYFLPAIWNCYSS